MHKVIAAAAAAGISSALLLAAPAGAQSEAAGGATIVQVIGHSGRCLTAMHKRLYWAPCGHQLELRQEFYMTAASMASVSQPKLYASNVHQHLVLARFSRRAKLQKKSYTRMPGEDQLWFSAKCLADTGAPGLNMTTVAELWQHVGNKGQGAVKIIVIFPDTRQ